jgi:hypothetical protein
MNVSGIVSNHIGAPRQRQVRLPPCASFRCKVGYNPGEAATLSLLRAVGQIEQ